MTISATEAPRTWRDVLSSAAEGQPDRTAFSFHPEQVDATPERIDYAGLDRRARAIGARLLGLGLGGRSALLFYPPGLEFVAAFFGCLYAGVVAVPAYPPTRNPRSLTRVVGMVRDSGAEVALTTAAGRDRMDGRIGLVPGLERLRLIATDDVPDTEAADWTSPVLDGGSLAFLQYTSGSTAAPRGVALTHDNLLANTALIQEAFGLRPDMRGVSWLPVYHDMGLIGSVMGTVRRGGTMALMAPTTFVRDPYRWLKAVSDERAVVSGAPNFAYDLCVERVTDEQAAHLDLSRWEVAFNGAEPVREDTMRAFADKFAVAGFRASALLPCYGLAEASLMVSAGPHGGGVRVCEPPAEGDGGGAASGVVASGAIPDVHRVEIVDPSTRTTLPEGVVGEIWVCGPSVAHGYWNRPEAEDDPFGRTLADEPGTPFLRTGDLGFVRDGQLHVTGRSKDLIIVRGRNHYPQDIELTAQRTSPALQPNGGAAFSLDEADGRERIAVVQEVRGGQDVDLDEAARRIRAAVAEEHEVRPDAVVLVRALTIPRTTSGKIARRACREALREGRLTVLSELRSETEEPPSPAGAEVDGEPDSLVSFLRTAIADVVGSAPSEIATDRPLVELGLDSLDAVRLQHRVQTQLQIDLELEDALAATIDELVLLVSATARVSPGAETADGPTDHPLSHNQRAMWFMHQFAPASAAHNIGMAARVSGRVDAPAMRRALALLSERHTALRTSFPVVDGAPAQRVHAVLEPEFTEHDLRDTRPDLVEEEAHRLAYRPFDVASGPLVRLCLLHGPDDDVLVLMLHHLVSDLWSMEVLLDELDRLYRAFDTGAPVPEWGLAPSHLRAVRHEAARLEGDGADRLADFWRDRLDGAPTELDLPTDHPRPAEQRFRTGTARFRLDADLTRALKECAAATGTTLYSVLLGAYQVFLSRHTGRDDVLVGTPVHGRGRAETAGTVGNLVNTAVLRGRIDPGRSFTDHTRAVDHGVREALRRDFPLPLLVERLRVNRDLGRQPLVQTLFTFQRPVGAQPEGMSSIVLGDRDGSLALGGLELRPVPLDPPNGLFDLSVTFAESADGLGGLLQYDTDLFTRETAERMARRLSTLLAQIGAAPERPVGELPMLDAEERERVLYGLTGTSVDHRPEEYVFHRFGALARSRPDDPAVAFDSAALATDTPSAPETVADVPTLTYAELDEASDRLAAYLVSRGVGPEEVVGLLLPRSADAVVAMLAVFKAGGAYLPIDADLPDERIDYIIEDSGARTVLTATAPERPLGRGVEVVALDTMGETLAAQPPGTPPCRLNPENTAYLIYTSGSTGRPKGVQVPHRAMTHFLEAMRLAHDHGPGDRVLAMASFSFDISVMEVFLPLITGGTVHIADTAVKTDGAQLRARLDSGLFSHAMATPATWQLLGDARWKGHPDLVVSSGGEALSPALAARLVGRGRALWNLYGPTETTVWSAAARIDEVGEGPVPIGSPLGATSVYVLGPDLEPVPEGVIGEVVIGGLGVVRGYAARPGLTADRFVPDPYTGPPGARMYRTGDLARFGSDGHLEFLGRADHQVKFHGHRIELGEIESALDQHPIVRRSAVLLHETESVSALVAYVEARSRVNTAAFDRQAADRALREVLRDRLPAYMVPTHFVWLAELPLNTSGKLDRGRLPAPEVAASTSSEAPATDTERALAGIVSELLGGARVGRDDNWFELGAHSLLLSRLLLRMGDSFGVRPPLHRLFEQPTLRGVAALVDEADGADEAAPPPARSITRVDRRGFASNAGSGRADVLRRLRAARGTQTGADS
ncbi:non-ribosomal peptide synthetase [Nocardiopsis sp. FIRDI 009]|uniref:non-ribosomal peptide synthetase n=1 Tax=Nocardiopsis sp. FIRDI 009 TaxID=714197 RepID=UPI0018E57540|nr:non-ribosomal peptide synthetase [Nocardiopsis sp. FIRDI 009]